MSVSVPGSGASLTGAVEVGEEAAAEAVGRRKLRRSER